MVLGQRKGFETEGFNLFHYQ